jgi:small subunit ribosomal protein S13e
MKNDRVVSDVVDGFSVMNKVKLPLYLLYPLNELPLFLILGLALEIPEDLYHLIKKAVAIRKHLERIRKDKDSKFRLILVESRIYRLARYYKKTKKLPPVWK